MCSIVNMCAIWNLYIPPNHRLSTTWVAGIWMSGNHFFDLFCVKLPMTSVQCSAPHSTSTYQILSGTERERKASISWSAVPETAPCPHFTLAFCDWGHTVMYFLGVVTPKLPAKQVYVRFLFFFFSVFTLCYWALQQNCLFETQQHCATNAQTLHSHVSHAHTERVPDAKQSSRSRL